MLDEDRSRRTAPDTPALNPELVQEYIDNPDKHLGCGYSAMLSMMTDDDPRFIPLIKAYKKTLELGTYVPTTAEDAAELQEYQDEMEDLVAKYGV
jgi:hypothetical protein